MIRNHGGINSLVKVISSNDGLKIRKSFEKQSTKISKVKKDKNINIFIDVTKIANSLGSEGIAINGEYKKKNATHLSVICDQNKLLFSF